MSLFYYDIDGNRFSNKIQALEHKNKTNKEVYLYYYDDLFDKVNWKIEPIEPLDSLYKHQAQRIRDEYDYVILLYSGGYDSTNILETFHYNNIKLDKIVVTGPFKQDKHSGTDNNHNGEIYRNAFPYLNELGLQSITQIVDYTDMYIDPKNFSIYELGDDWIYEAGSRFSPHHWFWRDLDRHIVPNLERDKKIAIIWGTDKPLIKKNQEGIYFRFNDAAITSYGRQNQPFRHNIDNINFYWDHNNPFILIKQLHLITNRYKIHNQYLNVTDTVDTIYNLKKPLLYKSSKTLGTALSIRDNFLLNHKNSDLYKFYNLGMNNLIKKFGKKNLDSIYSKKYIIQ